ncbi:MAG: M14 family metallopeptidase [Phycisphaeraceae bacterium]
MSQRMADRAFRMGWLALALLFTAVAARADAPPAPPAPPPVAGYADYATFRKQVEDLAKSDLVHVTILGKTRQQRDCVLLTLGKGKPETKPAILIVGNVHAPHLAGGEMVMRLARHLIEHADDDAVKALLDRVTLYLIPRPSPDASEAFFAQPSFEREGNARPTDDDRDFETDEDGPDDLDGDGVITLMRVEDPTGEWMLHPIDPRVLIKADAKKNEVGRYKLYTEGRDDDEDEAFNEDGPGGVSFNRNFTFKYPFFKPGAGPHQVSEPETRAIADFAYARTNIAAVITFTPEDNLFHAWKPNGQAEQQRIKTTLMSADAPFQDFLAEKYRDLHGGKDAPASPKGEGSFSEWAYFHYGRWSFAARGWWVAKAEEEKKKEKEEPKPEDALEMGGVEGGVIRIGSPIVIEHIKGDQIKIDGEQVPINKAKELLAAKKEKTPELTVGFLLKDAPTELRTRLVEICRELGLKRGAFKVGFFGTNAVDAGDRGKNDINALRWLEANKIDGFVDWKAIDHPDFKGRKVEVGGFKPYVLLNPPVKDLEALTEKHAKWLGEIVGLFPKVEISEAKVEALGGDAGVYRVTVTVINHGYLPTMSEMGRISRQLNPLQLAIDLPEGAKLVQGAPRTQIDVLKGRGEKAEHVYLVRAAKDSSAKLRVWSASVGEHSVMITFKEGE